VQNATMIQELIEAATAYKAARDQVESWEIYYDEICEGCEQPRAVLRLENEKDEEIRRMVDRRTALLDIAMRFVGDTFHV
jgi:hypothetical protein